MKRTSHFVATIVVTISCVWSAPQALAGGYTVSGTCGNWGSYDNSPARVAVYPQCPGLVARNVVGAFSSPPGSEGGWVFAAPPGTVITSFSTLANPAAGLAFEGLQGWQSTLFATGGGAGGSLVLQGCPGPTCPGANSALGTYSVPNATGLTLRMRCGRTPSCSNDGLFGAIILDRPTVTVEDFVQPSVRIAGGSWADGGWHGGTATVAVEASDNTGISAIRAYLDDGPRADQPRPACDWSSLYPCPNVGGAVAVGTLGLSDGAHTLTIVAVDSGGNTAAANARVLIDNTTPAQPHAARLAGGVGWRPSNSFTLEWDRSTAEAAPISSALFLLCPTGSSNASQCVSGERRLASDGQLALTVPSPGDWTARLWLRDTAGNADSGKAATVANLRFDPTPPTASVVRPSSDDPTQIHVLAFDAVSSIASGDVEIQRNGSNIWHALPTSLVADGLRATLDDSRFRDGKYTVRAHVVDAAGNERTTTSTTDGNPANVTLPLRIKTRLSVGKRERVRAGTARNGRPLYKRILVKRPRTGFGRTILIRGRLTTPGTNPVANVLVQVWEKVELPGRAWVHMADVTTTRTGRFSYRALRGPTRLVQFRYGGTPTIRPRKSTVEMLVRGSTSLKVDRHRLFNGEAVTFSGRVHGRPFPEAGKLVELQVYTRGRWRTFAQPRASATSGRWNYDYRFDTVQGRETFRFRARLRKEQGYPYELGVSHQMRVVVRGL